MPANLSPEYRKAEEAYRAAREPRERLDCLKEMLRTIPKHKGTDHLQADIKRRIKELTEELQAPRKGARRKGPVHTIRPEGAAQVALIGPPNAGKSALHARLTGSRTDVGPYPFTTHEPIPGMLAFEDVLFQIIDLPPVSADYMESWIVNALQPADAALLVVDLSDPACAEHVEAILRRLAKRRIQLIPRWPGLDGQAVAAPPAEAGEEEGLDPFRIDLPTLLVANKCELLPNADEELRVLEDLLDLEFPKIRVSAATGQGCEEIGPFLFRGLEIVRVYTKAPGRPPDTERPFTLRRGQTVMDVARAVHKDIASSLRYARVWGEKVYAGQQVGPDHLLCDRDILELHLR